jgi:DNA polymerase-1
MTKSKEFTPKLVDYWKRIEQPTEVLLAKMRRKGVLVNIEYCAVMESIGRERMAELESELGGKASSPKFLKSLLNDKLGLPVLLNKENKVSYDKETMGRYEKRLQFIADNEIKLYGHSDVGALAQRILEYRGWQKAVSGYYEPYQRFVDNDGRLRASYNITGTRTGRFSCSDPNLQQIPKESDKEWSKGVKGALIAESGYGLWELDYAQLEFRLAAAASHEDELIEIFADSQRDIFTEMAVVLGMVRQDTKTLNYSIQYGAGTPRVMDAFNVSESHARNIIENYYRQYPNLRSASKHFGNLAKRSGHVDIWSGRRRHFRNPGKEFYKAFNSYIQGGAADLVKLAMIEVDREVCDENCRLLLQVHDSLVLEIKEGMEDYYLPLIRAIMVRYSDYFGVRLDADAHRWSKPQEVKELIHV